MSSDIPPRTLPVGGPKSTQSFRRFHITVVAGADKDKRSSARENANSGAAENRADEEGNDETISVTSSRRRCSIGTQEGNDLVLTDPTVSRFHCEVAIDDDGKRFRVRDLGSKNGTRVGAVRILDGTVPLGCELTLGHSQVRLSSTDEECSVEATNKNHFGSLIGTSQAIREAFAKLERAAESDATVLLQGETGTGKEGAAEGLHAQSDRAAGPLVVLDCSALPATLIESELFGHEAGAFTGASTKRLGAFEEASGGTLFLDEIGELPLDLQPKLLRALEGRTISRLGSRSPIECDVRVIAATNRDLRAEVNSGRFRADLYYRLAVVRIELPPLRDRAGDITLLVEHFISRLAPRATGNADASALLSEEFIAALERARWPGNIRELRNHLESCLVMRRATPPETSTVTESDRPDFNLSYDDARRRSLETFERGYVEALLDAHHGIVAKAAAAAGMNRAYLYRLIKRYGLK